MLFFPIVDMSFQLVALPRPTRAIRGTPLYSTKNRLNTRDFKEFLLAYSLVCNVPVIVCFSLVTVSLWSGRRATAGGTAWWWAASVVDFVGHDAVALFEGVVVWACMLGMLAGR